MLLYCDVIFIIFFVEQDFCFYFFFLFQCFFDFGFVFIFGVFFVQEFVGIVFIYDVGLGVFGKFVEFIGVIDDRKIVRQCVFKDKVVV